MTLNSITFTIKLLIMNNNNYPVPPSHRTFQFGKIIIDSNFDSGNCSYAEKMGASTFAIWIGTDHPRNGYRMWFYFSVQGIQKGTVANFQIKNMQNQAKLLYEGLAPVFREEGNNAWSRISHKINLTNLSVNDSEMQWTFSHQFTSSQKHYFAFYFPWSNSDNNFFLESIMSRTTLNQDVYIHRGTALYSLQGRPIEMLTISSKRGLTQRQNNFDDNLLFMNSSKPKIFDCNKKCVIIGARVHPGEVPGSHVMNGIIEELIQDTPLAKAVRNNFIFYIFPIFNPDGVARGHFRVDTNGINLNRCYINPSPKQHSSIYAVKKIVMHCHYQGKYFAFLDLHAQASRKGNFIYGNSLNYLGKQVDACLFPKILSLNSEHFEYEGSNFLQKHMYHKDKSDHMSKEGCGRVAMYHATKNPNSWTLECSYNIGQKSSQDQPIKTDQQSLDQNIIKSYKIFDSFQDKQFYTIQNYHNLGKEILESLLDLIEANPFSRISNPNSYFKNITNIRLNLALALVKMSPNRFQPQYRKIHFMLDGTDNEKITNRCFKALYFMIIKKAKIPKLVQYLRDQDNTIQYEIQTFTSRQTNRRKTLTNGMKSPNKPTTLQNMKMFKKRIDKNDCNNQDQQSSSVVFTSQDSTNKGDDSESSCYSSLLRTKKDNPVIKIIEIDKQIYLRQANKEEFKMLGISSLQSRYESQQHITNYNSYKKKVVGKGQDLTLRKTYNQIFRLQILPKLITHQKAIISLSPALKHQMSLK